MKEHPILFSTPMVQAILEGRKTMTRRILKPQPDDDGLWDDTNLPRSLQSTLKGWNGSTEETGESREWKCPYGQVGDILWVRESWNMCPKDQLTPNEFYIERHDGLPEGEWAWVYMAESKEEKHISHPEWGKKRWKPSTHMPKAACRIYLEIIGIKVERLQDISEVDAIDEGVMSIKWDTVLSWFPRYKYLHDEWFKRKNGGVIEKPPLGPSPSQIFQALWQSINGEESWEENPWVWAITFKKIDHV
jgi:hypothetical protein